MTFMCIILTIVHTIGFVAAFIASQETAGWTGPEIACLGWCITSFFFAMLAYRPRKRERHF